MTTTATGQLRDIEGRVLAGERLTADDGNALYACDDLSWLGGLAREVQRTRTGDTVMFNVNRHLNLTNVCVASCEYCTFERKPGQPDAYTMRIPEAVRLAEQMQPEGLTELHIVNGLHPTLPYDYYPNAIRQLKQALPGVAIKAFTATEVDWFCELTGRDAETILDELIDAGLESLTGGGAEIFAEEVRSRIVDHDCHWERWSEIHELAHGKGLRTPATMLYGHIEEPRHRVDHVLRLRELQDRTGGFVTFIPLRFHPEGSRIPRPIATGAEAMKVFAVSRLLLDNFDRLKCFWVMHGLTLSQLLLEFGVDDLDGSVVEYKITHDPDGQTPDTMHRSDLLRLIREAGRIPVERDTRYRPLRVYPRHPAPDEDRHERPFRVRQLPVANPGA
ncbi:MAG: aminofutalosine synthase MqnE [Actinobacteria bacterium]|nr:aminofutalosine synthase MqnE [Actinomycetota bacterium]